MKHTRSPRLPIACALLCAAYPLHAQSLDWGTWDALGQATYGNGDTISISGIVGGSAVASNNETSQSHQISDPSFPYANAPGDGEFGFFRNEAATTDEWSILIDLSDFTFSSQTVIGFSNLDGKTYQTFETGTASIEFRDSSDNPIAIDTASFLGSYDTTFQGFTWDADSNFDLVTGIWSVVAGSGSNSDPYLGNVADAFFLTNLPENVDHIIYTKSSPTNYAYDSTLFYAANPVPEPGTLLCAALGGLGLLRRRR
ncbi:MAG: PEP-CTERM sorting domain-containing protein [Verrucomicrobiales bacterium]|nr:PEP-CTERM sorting domain-containing protein [Verrucomicrobiota bacterium JB025]